MSQLISRAAAVIVSLAVVVVLAGVAVLAAWNRPGPADEPVTVVVEPNTPAQEILAELAESQVIHQAWLARIGWRVFLGGAPLQAGEYRFAPGATPAQVLGKLQTGETVVHRVTIPAGLTSRAIVSLLRSQEALRGKIAAPPAEGVLLPETYHYRRGTTRSELLARMKTAMSNFLARTVPDSFAAMPLATKQDVVTLASIVEREAARGERRLVASVFLNRLRRGMRLQADATVLYALSDGTNELDRPLNRQDWEIDSPYNTYRYDGLPPGPIANPGRASIKAVLDPAETEYYYFVANQQGRHFFAETLAEHRANMARIKSGTTRVPRDPKKLGE